MDIFNASAMGMIFTKVKLDDLLEGDLEKLSQAQKDVTGQLGNAAAFIGGLSPDLQRSITEAMEARFPKVVHYMISAGHLAMQHRDKLAKLPEYVRKFGSGGVQMLSAGQIAASTTSAFITMCHVVASYDNALKLAEANIKLDELLKVHSREYKADLESVYNRLGDLFLELARGQDRAAQLQDCSQSLDRLVLIWLDEISNELRPVKESSKGLGALSSTQKSLKTAAITTVATVIVCPVAILAASYALLYAGPTVLVGRQIYSSWICDIKTRLGRVDRLMRRMGIAIWLRHVISHHAPTMQPLYNKYSTRLEQIGSKAGKIKKALLRSQKFISVEPHVIRRLEEVEALPQHVQAMLAPPQRLTAERGDDDDTMYKVVFYQGTILLEAVD